MTRRWPDYSRPQPRPMMAHDWILVGIASFIVGAVFLLLFALLLAVSSSRARAHDIWISRGVHKNYAGEWCCGTNDCGVLDKNAVHASTGGYSVKGIVTYGVGVTGNEADGPTHSEGVNDLIPYSQSLPSPDGAYWRCKRADGSPRCFFAPPPGS